jgi:acylphosphatase
VNVRAHVFVSGRVQGVFFRYETKRIARQRNVTGWARNMPDGRVEAIFEGDKAGVVETVSFCRKGPPGAVVRDVKVYWEEPTGEFKDFRIRYS